MSDFKVPLTYENKESGKTQFYLNELCRVFKFLEINMTITAKFNGEVKTITNPTPKLFSDFVQVIPQSLL